MTSLISDGAADGLPIRGSTEQRTVDAAIASAKRTYPLAAEVRVGPGIGVTYTIDERRRITYHRRPDYQLWVTFARSSRCPRFAAFVEGVPVFFVHTK